MQIGNVTINGKLALAPMAGVTDLAFRHICREHGAALTVTEMVSAKALCYKDKKTPRLLELGADEHPAAAQIFGHEPDTMAEGAKLALIDRGMFFIHFWFVGFRFCHYALLCRIFFVRFAPPRYSPNGR